MKWQTVQFVGLAWLLYFERIRNVYNFRHAEIVFKQLEVLNTFVHYIFLSLFGVLLPAL